MSEGVPEMSDTTLQEATTTPSTASVPVGIPPWVALDFDNLWGRGPRQLEYVIPDFLGVKEVGILASETGAGKSNVLLSLAVAAAGGKSALGYFEETSPSRVVYVDKEMGTGEFMRRLERLAVGMGAEPELVRRNLVVFCPDWPPDDPEGGSWSLNPHDTNSVEKFHETVRKFEADLVILDTFLALFGGDENKNDEVRNWYNTVAAPLRRDPGCSILIAHHFNKDQGYPDPKPSLSRLRGASDLAAFCEKVWVLAKRNETRDQYGPVVQSELRNLKARRGDSQEPLLVTIRDTSNDPLATTVEAEPSAGETGSRAVGDFLTEAGSDGLLRQDMVKRLAERGCAKSLGAADKMATRALKVLREAGKARFKPEGNGRRYWSADSAPPDAAGGAQSSTDTTRT